MACPFQRRLIVLCSVMAAGLSVLSVRLIHLQVVAPYTEESGAGRAREQRVVLPARRGLLADRNGLLLARNIAVADVIADRKHLGDPNLAALGLAYDRVHRAADWAQLPPAQQARRVLKERDRILEDVDSEEIKAKALTFAVSRLAKPLGLHPDAMRASLGGIAEGADRGEFVLVKDLQGDAADWAEEEARNCWIQGFRFERSFRRVYPVPDLATHVVGFADDSYRGKCGAEAALDVYLRGRDGVRVLKRDSRGLLMPAHAGHLLEPRPGLNVQLTIDIEMQAIVEEELERGLAEFNAPRGAAVVLEPHTGELLAMATRPHFDLNHREQVAEHGVNFAVQAVYEPGSTFKIVSVAGALDAGVVTPNTLINCHGGYYRDGPVEVRDDHPTGTVTVEGVIQRSSNIGAYLIGRQLGPRRFYQMAEALGFGRRTGIQLSGETSGWLLKTGNPVDFSRATYGYATSVTPLQVVSAYAAVANGGLLMQPRIAKRVVADDGRVIDACLPVVVRRALKETTAARMRKALEMVVGPRGTASRAAVPGFRVGGKTGTARKNNPVGRGYLAGRYIVSFIGIVPINDPAFVCLVVVDDPQPDDTVRRYGGTIAAPIFARIAPRLAACLNLQPTEPVEPANQLAGRSAP